MKDHTTNPPRRAWLGAAVAIGLTLVIGGGSFAFAQEGGSGAEPTAITKPQWRSLTDEQRACLHASNAVKPSKGATVEQREAFRRAAAACVLQR